MEGFEYPVSCVQDDVAAPKLLKKIPLIKSPSRGNGACETT